MTLIGLRTSVATRIAPWLNHPNLRATDYALADWVPVPVSRQLIAANGNRWGCPMRARLWTAPDGRIEMHMMNIYSHQTFDAAWDEINANGPAVGPLGGSSVPPSKEALKTRVKVYHHEQQNRLGVLISVRTGTKDATVKWDDGYTSDEWITNLRMTLEEQ